MASKVVVRSITLMAAVCCLAGIGADRASAQAVVVTATPSSLSFGVPSNGSTSAPQTTTLTLTGGDGPTSIAIGSVTPPSNSDFKITSDTCSGKTITSPGACSLDVTFKSTQDPGHLEFGNFQIPYTLNAVPQDPKFISLTGASGALKLFNPINVEPSNPNAGNPNDFAFGSAIVNLSCSTGFHARLSSSPDGSGNVMADNFLTLAINGDPVEAGSPAGNVCTSGFASDGSAADCFTEAYRTAANSPAGIFGQNPDNFTNADNGVLDGGAAGGIPPIDVSSYLASIATIEGPPTQTPVTFSLVDRGGKVASSTLFLVTDCAAPGVQTGGTLTGNPLDPAKPESLVQDFPFNTAPGNHITLTANFLGADTFDPNGAATPNVNDTGIRQENFPPMVTGTSVAPAVCIKLNGEVAADGQTKLCKAFTITCTDPVTGIAAGKNCPQKQAVAAANKLFFETKLDSPDAVVIAPGTGPGLLEGTDTWATATTAMGALKPCSVDTPPLFPDDDGEVSGQLCPQNPLTEFKGAGDPISGSTPRGVNSTFIPVLNVPLPFSTFTTTPPMTTAGWVNSQTVTINFTSNPATYGGPNPNGFTPAAIASLTYGTQTPVPDPTFGVNGDVTNSNASGTGACPGLTVGPFASSTTPINFGADGIFNNVHYFATDCAGTEELAFTPSANPNQNWASFKTATIKIDTVAPTISAITFDPSSTGNIFASGQKVHPLFTCSDDRSGIASCVGTGGVAGDGTGLLNTMGTGSKTFTVTATDNAGNVTTSSVTYQLVGSSELVMLNLTKLTVNAGTSLVFRFGVINFGPAVANNVVFKTTLPGGVTFNSNSAGFGTVSCVPGSCADMPAPPSSCSVSAGVVTCNIPTVGLITKLTGVLVKITVNVPAGTTVGSIIKDTATVKAVNTDPISFDNTATSVTQVCSTTGWCPH
jgi:uncharacterized repeat protein (TIGR01451 family)